MRRDRITLIYPPWVLSERNYRGSLQNCLPPLGLLSIASHLEANGFEVRVIDMNVERLNGEGLRARLAASPPDLIGISVLTAMAVAANRIARVVKDAAPGCLVVCGGVHAEVLPQEMLRNSAIDAVVIGDGEGPMLRFAQGAEPREVAGAVWRGDGRLERNPPGAVEMDLDRYPMPAYHLVPMERYFPAVGTYRNLPAINMLMTRGCPGKCTFCNSAETVLRTRGAAKVVEEIAHLRERFGIRQVQFYDDTFTVSRANVMEFCRLMAERDLGVSWCAYVRADCLNDEMASAMRKAGCHQVLIGVETGDPGIARNIGKPIPLDRVEACVARARRHGLEVRASFILGNAGETRETMERTLDFAIRLDPDVAQFNISTPYPGTRLFRWAKSGGRLRHEDWTRYDLSGFLVDLPDLTEEEVFAFERHAARRFYLRPRAVLRHLRRLTHPRQVRDLLFGFLVFVFGMRNRVSRTHWAAWLGDRKEDFFDLPSFAEGGEPPLSFEARRPVVSGAV
ncbi:MAG: cobalamin B12-binding domain-containing protein [Planctomycetes bacterium]|nr:cobalamin B12-binding domain-containing protein [Planctomycetota bacterium]